jgi:hypothetical protein
MALAFLPVILALVTLIALYFYQRGAGERRDRWQKPGAVLDTIGVRPGMQVAEWKPSDTYFLARLAGRVGTEGAVYAVLPEARLSEAIESELPRVKIVSELPRRLDVLLVSRLSVVDQDREIVESELEEIGSRLEKGSRVGFLGIRSDALDAVLQPDDVAGAAEGVGLRTLRHEDVVDRQFLLVLEKS